MVAVQLSYIATAGMETDEQVAAGSASKEGAETSTSRPAGAHTTAKGHQAGMHLLLISSAASTLG